MVWDLMECGEGVGWGEKSKAQGRSAPVFITDFLLPAYILIYTALSAGSVLSWKTDQYTLEIKISCLPLFFTGVDDLKIPNNLAFSAVSKELGKYLNF